uniref:Putative secreted protein n=1 Tax=Panstrongylus lignarius TaxID=156445 RepID=A0A224Y4T3_9HEMI
MYLCLCKSLLSLLVCTFIELVGSFVNLMYVLVSVRRLCIFEIYSALFITTVCLVLSEDRIRISGLSLRNFFEVLILSRIGSL